MSSFSTTIKENVDHIMWEFESMQNSVATLKTENERLKNEKNDLVTHSRKYYETAFHLNLLVHKFQIENSRLKRIIAGMSKILPAEEQKILEEERLAAENITVADIEKKIKTSSNTKEDPFYYESELSVSCSDIQKSSETLLSSVMNPTSSSTSAASSTQQQQPQPQPLPAIAPVVPITQPAAPLSSTQQQQQQQQQPLANTAIQLQPKTQSS